MKIGYARVSTDEQNLSMQLDELTAAGCSVIYQDAGVSGMARKRGGLSQAFAALKAGDTLTVWKLDRLGRSLGFLCETVERLGHDGIGFQSLTDGIDTATAGGKLVFHIMGALAEFERDLIRERTKTGMKAAKKRGKHVGRPFLLNKAQSDHMQELIAEGRTQKEVAVLLGVSANTIGRAYRKTLQQRGDQR